MKPRLLRLAIYFMAFGFGLTLTMLSPIMPYLVKSFSLTLTEGGLLTSAINFGGVSGLVVLLFAADRLRKQYILWTAYAVFGVLLLGASFATGYVGLLLLLYGMGAGARVVDCISNAVMGDRFPESGAYLGFMHTALGLGAFAAPLLINWLIGFGWQMVFRAFGVLLTLLLVFSIAVEYSGKRLPLPAPVPQASGDRKRLLRDPVFWLVTAMMFFYSGHQSILASWGTMYASQLTGLPDSTVNWILAAYWGGIVLGRAAAAKWLPEEKSVPAVIAGSLISTAALVGALVVPQPFVMAALYLVAGVASAYIVPVMVRWMYRRAPAQSGFVSTIFYFAMAGAPMLFPLFAGGMADMNLFAVGMQLSSVALVVIAVIGLVLKKRSA